MIRPATLADINAILDLSIACGLFPVDGTGELAGVLTSTLNGELGSDHVWLVDDDGGLAGVAYFAPERMADGTWNLYMLAIHPTSNARVGEQHLSERSNRICNNAVPVCCWSKVRDWELMTEPVPSMRRSAIRKRRGFAISTLQEMIKSSSPNHSCYSFPAARWSERLLANCDPFVEIANLETVE